MANKKQPTGHLRHLGHTIPAAAAELNVGEGVIRRAVDRGEIEVIPFGGLRRIPPREIERLRELFGLRQQTA